MDSAPRINTAASSAASYITRKMTFFRRIEIDPPLPYQGNEMVKGFFKGEVKFLADFLCRHGSGFKQYENTVLAQLLPNGLFQHLLDPSGIRALTIDIFFFQ